MRRADFLRVGLGAGIGAAAASTPTAKAWPYTGPGWEAYVDGKFGSDSDDGFTWLTAKRTLQAAHDTFPDGTTIRFGQFEPREGQGLVVTKNNMAFIGNSHTRSPYSGAWITPPGASAVVIQVLAANCTLENMMVQGDAAFCGVAFDFSHADGQILRNVTYNGTEDADSNKYLGGTGFRFQHSERVSGTDMTVQNATLGLLIGAEASSGLAINFGGGSNYQDIVADGGGGWTFTKSKLVNSGKPGETTPVVHFKPGAGEFLLDGVDWCEAGPNKVLIESDANVMVRPVSAPATVWQIDGDHNSAYGRIVGGTPWIVNGAGNRLDL